MKKQPTRQLTVAALLIALSILIPMVMPKIIIGPASFTLASHVPLFIAMFFSPWMAIVVGIGTGVGFFLSATPIIAFRAFSHLSFAIIGALCLRKYPTLVLSKGRSTLINWRFQLFNLVIAMIHSLAELVVVSVFYSIGNVPDTYYSQGYVSSILLIMGLGGLLHSLIDYDSAYFIAARLSKQFYIPVFNQARKQLDHNFDKKKQE